MQIGDNISLTREQVAVITQKKIDDLQPGHQFVWGGHDFRIDGVGEQNIDVTCVATMVKADQVYNETPPPHQDFDNFHPTDFFDQPLPDDGPSRRDGPFAKPKTGLLDKFGLPADPNNRAGDMMEKVDILGPELKSQRPTMMNKPPVNEPYADSVRYSRLMLKRLGAGELGPTHDRLLSILENLKRIRAAALTAYDSYEVLLEIINTAQALVDETDKLYKRDKENPNVDQ